MDDEDTINFVLPDNKDELIALHKSIEELLRVLKAPRKLVRDEKGRITGSIIE